MPLVLRVSFLSWCWVWLAFSSQAQRADSTFAVDVRKSSELHSAAASPQGKVAAIGVHIKRWVTTHGFALNVNTDLSYYNWIIACEGEPVTSMEKLLGREVDMSEVEDSLEANFRSVFGYVMNAVAKNATAVV